MAYNVDHLLRVGDAKTIYDSVNGRLNVLDSAANNTAYFNSRKTNSEADWQQGHWTVADGQYKEPTATAWVCSRQILDSTVITITATETLKLILCAYEENTYIGAWMGSNFTKTYDSSYVLHYIDLIEFRKNYPTYTFKLDATPVSGEALTPEAAAQGITILRSQIEELKRPIACISGDLTRAELWENGTIDTDGSKFVDKNSLNFRRLATNPLIRVTFPITITPKSDIAYIVAVYSLSGAHELLYSDWRTVPFTLQDSNKLYRIVLKSNSNANLCAENIADYISTDIVKSTPFDRMLAEFSTIKAVSHRGVSAVAPENTLPAFEMSAAMGFKYVECDIQFTSDGVPVILHDPTINRTARNADGTELSETVNIGGITYEEALEYDFGIWKGEAYAGTKIPTFEEFLRCCRTFNLHPWIELKSESEYTQEIVQLLISTVFEAGMGEHVTFISFSYDILALVADEWDSVELGLNGTVANALALKTGKNRVFTIYAYNADFSAALAAGLDVAVYTVDTEVRLAGISDGFDGVITNILNPSQVYNAIRNKYINT